MDRAMNKANWLLAAVLLLAVAAYLDSRSVPTLSRDARAQGSSNPAEDRLALISELQGVNARLDRLIGLVESGKVKVVIGNAEELREATRGAGPAVAAPPGGENRNAAEPKIIIKRKGD